MIHSSRSMSLPQVKEYPSPLLISLLGALLCAGTISTTLAQKKSESSQSVIAQSKTSSIIAQELKTAAKKSIDKGIHFLRQQQAKDGSYGHHVGLTSMVLLAMAESPRRYTLGDGPFVRRAAEFVVSQAKANGSNSYKFRQVVCPGGK